MVDFQCPSRKDYIVANTSILELNGHVSRSLWIYFVLSAPLTLIVFGVWFMLDRKARRKQNLGPEDDEDEAKITAQLEARIMRKLRRRTGIRVADTGDFPLSGHTSGQA